MIINCFLCYHALLWQIEAVLIEKRNISDPKNIQKQALKGFVLGPNLSRLFWVLKRIHTKLNFYIYKIEYVYLLTLNQQANKNGYAVCMENNQQKWWTSTDWLQSNPLSYKFKL